MKNRLAALAINFGVAALAVAALGGRADAQQTLCSNKGFASGSGTLACDGTASPVTATASVKSAATLTLEQVFGSAASSLNVGFGNVDAQCLTAAGAGLTCSADTVNNWATYYGDIQFTVKLTGGAGTAKLTGIRPSAGSIPAGQLLDGASGSEPATAYPVSPSTAADLKTAIGNGKTTVTRSFGLKVTSTDAAGNWSGPAAYSLVIE